MLYEWDEEKNRTNLLKHGLDFTDAWEIFNAPMLILLDDREDYGEDRWIGIGLLRSRVVVVIYTERGEDTIRIISLRKALSHERTQYEKALRDGLGQS
ncbi:MAG TPA: BrnT family toxin [Chloroflexia bacterium]|nr:BrnT family toxin [Chloroflexia bacterium]